MNVVAYIAWASSRLSYTKHCIIKVLGGVGLIISYLVLSGLNYSWAMTLEALSLSLSLSPSKGLKPSEGGHCVSEFDRRVDSFGLFIITHHDTLGFGLNLSYFVAENLEPFG